MSQLTEDSTKLQVKHDASGEHLFLVTNYHVLRGGATVEIWFIPQYGNDYIHVSLPLVDGESKEPNWSTAAVGIHPDVAPDVAVLPVTMLKGTYIWVFAHKPANQLAFFLLC